MSRSSALEVRGFRFGRRDELEVRVTEAVRQTEANVVDMDVREVGGIGSSGPQSGSRDL